jgi:anaerobic magnesium-protoporphyrin IX monomethyl ester cyclase
MGGKWRSQSPTRVIEELQSAKPKYRCDSFTVVDDNFTLNLKRVENICDLLISARVNLRWNSQNGIRADRIREDLARKMKSSGCQFVWIGIETADEQVFKTINKGEELINIEKGIGYLKRAGIQVGGFFIVGLPYSTRDADLKSVHFVLEHGIGGWWFNFVPYPQTEAWKWVQNHGRLLRPIEGALQYDTANVEPVFDTEEYPKETRMKTYEEIHVRLKYFDRLVDPSLRQLERWSRTLKIVAPYGIGNIMHLLIFILKYNARLALQKI